MKERKKEKERKEQSTYRSQKRKEAERKSRKIIYIEENARYKNEVGRRLLAFRKQTNRRA